MDGLRAYAVCLIFFIHFFGHYFNGELGRPRLDFERFDVQAAHRIDHWTAYYLWASHYGVDLFFLISGFLIFKMVARAGFSYPGFLWNRVVRLYPAFVVAIGLYLAYMAAYWQRTFDFATIGQNLLLLHGIWELKIDPVVTATWSLAYEWIFYIVFPLVLLVRRKGSSPSFWHLAFLAALVLFAAAPIGHHYMRLLMFVLGAALALAGPDPLRRIAARLPDGVVLVAYLAGNLVFVAQHNWYYFIPLYMVTAGALFINVVYGNDMLHRTFCWAPLNLLGRLSYSFYLLHSLAIFIVCDNVGPQLGIAPGLLLVVVLFILSFALAMVFAAVSFWLLERPYFERRIPTHEATRDRLSF